MRNVCPNNSGEDRQQIARMAAWGTCLQRRGDFLPAWELPNGSTTEQQASFIEFFTKKLETTAPNLQWSSGQLFTFESITFHQTILKIAVNHARIRLPDLAQLTVSLLAALTILHSPAAAAVLLSDHFTGNSGSVPSGWSDFGFDTNGASTIVESGTVVTVTDTRGNGGPQFMQSSVLIAPEALSLTIGIDSMTSFAGSDP